MSEEISPPPARPLAVVTGASDGLGKEFARQLAAGGYDLLVVARREPLLNTLKNELETAHGISVEVHVCDLSVPADVARLEQKLETTERLEFMVNNAGFGRGGAFPHVNPDFEQEMIQVHVVALMRLSRAALVPMCARRRGFLINVASVAGFLHGTGCAQYAATKAYVISFSKSIQCDVAQRGIHVQALCPGMTHTGFHAAAAERGVSADVPVFAWLDAPRVVRASLRQIRRAGAVICVPSLRYKIFLALARNPIGERIFEWIYRRRAAAALSAVR